MILYINKNNGMVTGTGDVEYEDSNVYSIISPMEVGDDILDYKVVNGKLVKNQEIVDKRASKIIKNQKIYEVDNLVVTTTSGKVFDGDEISQNRLTRAINVANITGETSTQWKLADNIIVTVTLDELKEALALAGQAMSGIWLK